MAKAAPTGTVSGTCVVTALWVAVAGQAVAVLPVLLSPLVRIRDLPVPEEALPNG